MALEPAFPMVVPRDPAWHVGGLTKLEYAMVHLAAGLASDPEVHDVPRSAEALAEALMERMAAALRRAAEVAAPTRVEAGAS